MKNYKRRIMDSLLEKKLQAKGAVLIEGPQCCGKATTAEEIAASKIMLAKPDIKNHLRRNMEIDYDTAAKVCDEFGILCDKKEVTSELESLDIEDENDENAVKKPLSENRSGNRQT